MLCCARVLQVCRRLSAGQAAVVSDSGSGEPHPASRVPLLRGQSTGGTMPALLPMHEVSLRRAPYVEEEDKKAAKYEFR